MERTEVEKIIKRPNKATPQQIIALAQVVLEQLEKKEKELEYYREYNKKESRKKYMIEYMKKYYHENKKKFKGAKR